MERHFVYGSRLPYEEDEQCSVAAQRLEYVIPEAFGRVEDA